MSDQIKVVESQRGAPLLNLNAGFSYTLRHRNKDSCHASIDVFGIRKSPRTNNLCEGYNSRLRKSRKVPFEHFRAHIGITERASKFTLKH